MSTQSFKIARTYPVFQYQNWISQTEELIDTIPLPDNVLFWGAKGNGVTNDSAAIQRAINANTPGCLFFPPGTYVCNDPVFARDNMIIYGCGKTVSVLKATLPLSDSMFICQSVINVQINDLGFNLNSQTITVSYPIGVSYNPAAVHIRGNTTTGIAPSTRIKFDRCEYANSNDTSLVSVESGSVFTEFASCRFLNAIPNLNVVSALDLDTASRCTIDLCEFDVCQRGINCHTEKSTIISNCRFSSFTSVGIVDNAQSTSISGNSFSFNTNSSIGIQTVDLGLGFDTVNSSTYMGNTFRPLTDGVTFAATGISASQSRAVSIVGNTFSNLSVPITAFSDNTISGNTIWNQSAFGTGITVTGSRNTVTNNYVYLNNIGITATTPGGEANTIANNTVYLCGQGIVCGLQSKLILSNNQIIDWTSNGINFTASIGTVTFSTVSGNTFSSPITTPTFGLTTGTGMNDNNMINNNFDAGIANSISTLSLRNRWINNMNETTFNTITVAMTTDNQQITTPASDYKKIVFTSDNATPANRTAILNAGFYVGQTMLLVGPVVNSMEIANNVAASDGTLTFLTGGANLTLANTFIYVRFDGTNWYQA